MSCSGVIGVCTEGRWTLFTVSLQDARRRAIYRRTIPASYLVPASTGASSKEQEELCLAGRARACLAL